MSLPRALLVLWIAATTVWFAVAGYSMWVGSQLQLPPPAQNEVYYAVKGAAVHYWIRVAIPPLILLGLGWGLVRLLRPR
jgi:hypothetical protein